MKRTYTLVVGLLFVVIGLAAFLPFLAPANDHGQLLLGIFQINTAQTMIHLLTGALALGTLALAKDYYIGSYVKVFGVVYTLVAIWGLPAFMGSFDGVLFGLIHINVATELLHMAIGLAGLYAGFFAQESVSAPRAA